MKIFVSHPRKSDFKNELYTPLRNSALNEKFDFFLPHENDREINTKEEIKSSDLLIVEVSFPATGGGIEMGWADAFNIPILCIRKKGSVVSGSLRYITDHIIEYSDTEDLVNKLSRFLESEKF